MQTLRKRFNTHRAGMKDSSKDNTCKILCDHFNSGLCKGSDYKLNIIEKLEGTGIDVDGKRDPTVTKIRTGKETNWMLLLRTVYPYGLNDRIGNEFKRDRAAPIATQFPSLKRNKVHNNIRSRIKNPTNETIDFVKLLSSKLITDLPNAMNFLRYLLSPLKKKILRKIAGDISEFLAQHHDNFPFKTWYFAALDFIDAKIYKPYPTKSKKNPPKNIFQVIFSSKALDFINLPKILRNPYVTKQIPTSLDKNESPMVVYTLTKPIRSKIFNYKTFVEELNVGEVISNPEMFPCNCQSSKFKNNDHNHVISGDIRIIKNNKLRKLISKGPKYREPLKIEWKSVRDSILISLDECVENWSVKSKINKAEFLLWKNSIIEVLDAKILHLKQTVKPINIKQVLKDPDVKIALEELHHNFVIVPIDKAANNVAFVCKRYYAMVLLTEMGLIGGNSLTYEVINDTTANIVKRQTDILKESFKIDVTTEQSCLPVAYWLPKMHKNPIGKRFIIASKKCAVKQLSKHVTSAFKLFYNLINTYHEKTKFYTGINTFWVIQNNVSVLKHIEKINKRSSARSISTFDFSTLYTKIPHDKLIDVLTKLIDFAFKGGTRNKISINFFNEAYWDTNPPKSTFFFAKTSIIEAVDFLIQNCYFCVGNTLLRQKIGIPMGLDPAPFFANLFLFYYESEWLKKLKKSDNIKARKFGNTFRFIDDLIAMNDGGEFESSHHEIYPPELELKKENLTKTNATFLDLELNISEKQIFTKLFDKRDDFPFSIVRLPYKQSNMPSKMFYSSLGAEFLRICRATSNLQDVKTTSDTLIKRMLNQGAILHQVEQTLRRVIQKHTECFLKYNTPVNLIVQFVLN